jgi:Amt family ammonium transporter
LIIFFCYSNIFPAFVVFTLLWATFGYDPLAHGIWGVDGWMRNMGILDFAGGTVVHISSGISGLIIALMIGKPSSWYKSKNCSM